MTPPPFQSESIAEASPTPPAPLASAPSDTHADDMRLLRRYVDQNSQAAFAQLTAKHLPWVFAMCRRSLRDKHLAEDASQAVFVLLARRAATLSDQSRVAGWLFNTTRFVLKDVRKSEGRFQRRQGVARELARDRQLDFGSEDSADRIDPRLQAALDEGLALLADRDRQALMMHFYEALTLPQMAERLGITRDGAKKRVARALARLRTLLGKGKAGGKKTALSIVALALLLRARDVSAATLSGSAVPPGLYAATVAASTVPGAAGVLVEQILAGVTQALAAASKRLLHAMLIGQSAVAVVIAVVALTRPAGPAAAPTSRRTTTFAAAVSTGQQQINTLDLAAGPAAGSPTPTSTPAPSTAAHDPDLLDRPYRSGADDPDPAAANNSDKPKPADDAPGAAAKDTPRLLSNAGSGPAGGASASSPGDGAAAVFSGYAPVARTYAGATGTPVAPPPIVARPAFVPDTTPRTVSTGSVAVRSTPGATDRPTRQSASDYASSDGSPNIVKMPRGPWSDPGDALANCPKPPPSLTFGGHGDFGHGGGGGDFGFAPPPGAGPDPHDYAPTTAAAGGTYAPPADWHQHATIVATATEGSGTFVIRGLSGGAGGIAGTYDVDGDHGFYAHVEHFDPTAVGGKAHPAFARTPDGRPAHVRRGAAFSVDTASLGDLPTDCPDPATLAEIATAAQSDPRAARFLAHLAARRAPATLTGAATTADLTGVTARPAAASLALADPAPVAADAAPDLVVATTSAYAPAADVFTLAAAPPSDATLAAAFSPSASAFDVSATPEPGAALTWAAVSALLFRRTRRR